MVRRAIGEELLLTWVVDHLDPRDLGRLELVGPLLARSPYVRAAWRSLGAATGALAYGALGTLGEGPDPKAQFRSWVLGRGSFLGRALLPPAAASPTEKPSAEQSRVELLFDARCTSVATTPSDASSIRGRRVGLGTYSVPQLPRKDRPVLPLAFGVQRGTPIYAEFQLAWEEKGNGEACQLSIAPLADEAAGESWPALAFSPSAGSLARYAIQAPADGSGFRAWPLQDLWLDARAPGTASLLEVGVYIDTDGRVTFYRRGPLSQSLEQKDIDPKPLWEAVGCFDWQLPVADNGRGSGAGSVIEPSPRAFHIALCVLDEHTPLRATLARLAEVPPVPAPAGLVDVAWRWHSQP